MWKKHPRRVEYIGGVDYQKQSKLLKDGVEVSVERLKTGTIYWMVNLPPRGFEPQGFVIEGYAKSFVAAKTAAMTAYYAAGR